MTPETETPIIDELAAIAAFYAERDRLAAEAAATASEPAPEVAPAELAPPQPLPTLNDYYIRCREADRPKLYALAEALGILINTDDMYTLAPAWEGGWSEVGTIYRATGETDAEGRPITTPVCDPEGNPYWHANLRLKIVSLTDLAVSVASTNPEVASALADLSGWFVSDAQGQPVPPKQPAQVWL